MTQSPITTLTYWVMIASITKCCTALCTDKQDYAYQMYSNIATFQIFKSRMCVTKQYSFLLVLKRDYVPYFSNCNVVSQQYACAPLQTLKYLIRIVLSERTKFNIIYVIKNTVHTYVRIILYTYSREIIAFLKPPTLRRPTVFVLFQYIYFGLLLSLEINLYFGLL